MNLSVTEENYLKSIYTLSLSGNGQVSTNAIAAHLENSPASVTDMVKKLASKGLVEHIPYRGISLNETGRRIAIFLIRKHRLWECFLFNKLGFGWEELHDMAEQLEHIRSSALVNRLEEFLGFPKFDPHGDPIPDREGNTAIESTINLNQAPTQKNLLVKSVADESGFLQYLTEIGISIGTEIRIDRRIAFDDTLKLIINNQERSVSPKVAERIFVKIN